MRDVGDWLKDADPVVTAPPRSTDDIARLRGATLNAAQSQYATRRGWPGAIAVALTLVLAFAFSGWASGYWSHARSIARQSPPLAAPPASAPPASASAPAASDVRQLQFATPGGTRIIWVFNPDFSL